MITSIRIQAVIYGIATMIATFLWIVITAHDLANPMSQHAFSFREWSLLTGSTLWVWWSTINLIYAFEQLE